MDKITWNPMTTVKPLEPVGQRVIIDGAYTESWKAGTIVGHAVLPPRTTPGEAVLVYLIELDTGFHHPDGETFVSVMAIAADAPDLRIGEE